MANMPICSIDGCNKPSRKRGWCNMHYHRWRAHGDTGFTKDPSRKFLEKAVAFDGEGCLLWWRNTKTKYINVTVSQRRVHAHRFICEVRHGAPPTPKHQAAHNCGNRLCVNPAHIRWATPAENTHDKHHHGTMLSGDRHPRATLRQAQVGEIRSLLGKMPIDEIAARYGVTKSAISAINTGRTWKRSD